MDILTISLIPTVIFLGSNTKLLSLLTYILFQFVAIYNMKKSNRGTDPDLWMLASHQNITICSVLVILTSIFFRLDLLALLCALILPMIPSCRDDMYYVVHSD